MDIGLLSKLAELKQHEVDECKRDLETLNKIVDNYDKKLVEQQEIIDVFINEFMTANSSAEEMLSGRAYLKELDEQHKEINQSRLEAEEQKHAAFDSLMASVVELKKFTKLIEKMQTTALEIQGKKEFIIDDENELYRYNNRA